ncbi:uncharacterized protein M6B38_170040 [Iris pallida]|uniref:Uncharacterized protein n=1 Tax=Iris pallida TaxID=29817 RepID=A0AAX6EVG8_IRIPA|nr:uncharacterized protein M6B38_170040 [Iris pallida]
MSFSSVWKFFIIQTLIWIQFWLNGVNHPGSLGFVWGYSTVALMNLLTNIWVCTGWIKVESLLGVNPGKRPEKGTTPPLGTLT